MKNCNDESSKLRIFHYSPWYTYVCPSIVKPLVENLSLFALIYLLMPASRDSLRWESFIIRLDILTTPDLLGAWGVSWESFIIRLDILNERSRGVREWLRIFHYSPWYTYAPKQCVQVAVENLSLFTLIYLLLCIWRAVHRWESFIIRLDILSDRGYRSSCRLRIFHYSPWYTYTSKSTRKITVENLSLFALIYLLESLTIGAHGWESFIIRLDILKPPRYMPAAWLRIFHYSPWYT